MAIPALCLALLLSKAVLTAQGVDPGRMGGAAAGVSIRRRMQAAGASTCDMSSAPRGEMSDPLWYALVDGKPIYDGPVNASHGVTLYCTSSANITTRIPCDRVTGTWDTAQVFPQCRDCHDQLFSNTVGSMRVYNLSNGDTVTLRPTKDDWLGCGQGVDGEHKGPPETRPFNRSEGVSFAFTIMADSLADRWITASTCGLQEVAYVDTQLRVRGGCDVNATRLIENGDFCGIQSQLAFLAEAGQSYTVYLSSANRTCVEKPAISLKAEEGSLPALSKQSFLISPSLATGQCFSAQAPDTLVTLQPCDSTHLDQYIQIKDVGNGRIFLRPTHWNENTTLIVSNSTGTPRLVAYDEPGVGSLNPYKEPGITLKSSADSDPLVWQPPEEEEQFIIRESAEGRYQIQNPVSGTCLDWLDNDLTLSPCTVGSPSQSFIFTKPAGSTPAGLPLNTPLRVKMTIAIMCWMAFEDTIHLRPCNETDEPQTFSLRDAGNGFAQVLHQDSSGVRVLELPPGSMDDGAVLRLNPNSTGAMNQLWSLLPSGVESFRFVSALTSLCLETSSVDLYLMRQFVCCDSSTAGGGRGPDLFQTYSLVPLVPPGDGSPVPSPPPYSQQQTQGDSKAAVPAGAIAGIVVGIVALVTVCGTLVVWVMTKRRRTQQGTTLAKGLNLDSDSAMDPAFKETSGAVKDTAHVDAVARQKLQIKGLVKGEPFLRGAAPHFTWSDLVPGPACQAVEEGVNAEQLDKLAAAAAGAGAGSPVVQLSSAEIAQQIELLKEGLLGRGATALVFKCRWPSRFGLDALLACKVLRDPFDGELTEHLQAFQYEARVLEELRHPNIVRLYGYCLEAPTVCLIMELLPSSLKRRLGRSASTTRGPLSNSLTPVPKPLHHMSTPLAATASNITSADNTGNISSSALNGIHGSRRSSDSNVRPSSCDVTIDMAETGGPLPSVLESQWERGSFRFQEGTTQDGPPSQSGQPGTPKASPPMPPAAAPGQLDLTTLNPSTSSTQGPAAAKASLDGTQVVCRVEMLEKGLEGQAPPVTQDSDMSAVTDHSAFSAQASAKPSPSTRYTLKPTIRSANWDPGTYEIGSSASVPNSLTSCLTSKASVDVKTVHQPWVSHASTSQQPSTTPHAALVLDVDVASHAVGTAYTPSTIGALGSPIDSVPVGAPHAGPSGLSHVSHNSMTHHSSSSAVEVSTVSAPAVPKLSMLEVLRMSTDVACGLAYLHQRPAPELTSTPSVASSVTQSGTSSMGDGRRMIVHRDLKPDNVLVNSLGVAKICDFGLARAHDSTTIYSVHLAVGTLRYMAPELLDGETNKPVTDRVDLYSLGMLMWEMVTGEPPWKGLTDPQIMTAVQLKKRPSMSTRGLTSPSPRTSPFPRSQEDRAWLAPNTLGENEVFAEDLYPSRQMSAMSSTSFLAPSGFGPGPGTPFGVTGERSSAPNLAGGASAKAAAATRPQSAVSSPNLGASMSIPTSITNGCMLDAAASFDAIPQFKTLVSACWQHNSIRRPTAHAVHKQLAALLRQQELLRQQPHQHEQLNGGQGCSEC